MKKSFLLWNTDACFLGLAQRLEQEGYKLYSYYAKSCEKYSKDSGKGIVNIVDDMYDVLYDFKDKKNDLIILIDGNDKGDQCDYLKSEGWHIIGSSNFSEEIEHERAEGNKLAENIGLNIPPAKEFSDFGKAIQWLEALKAKNDNIKLVFKADGWEYAGSSKTYLANTVDEMIEYTKWVAEECEDLEKFRYQRIIEGQEVDFAGWFDGERFAPSLYLDFEQKRIHGLGQAEGCMGQIITMLDPREQPYFKDYMVPLAKRILKTIPNEWAVNNIIEEKTKKPYFLEFTPRFGWDSTVGELALIEDAGQKIGDFFERIAFKKGFPKGYFPYGRYSCTIRIYSGGIGMPREEVEGRPIFWDKRIEKYLWLYAVQKKDFGYVICGNPVGCATACGNTPEEAMKKVYKMIARDSNLLVIPDIFYSETIGEGVSKTLRILKTTGVIK